jgi:hypothetical protein
VRSKTGKWELGLPRGVKACGGFRLECSILSRAGVGGPRSLVLQTVHAQSMRKFLLLTVGSQPFKGMKQAPKTSHNAMYTLPTAANSAVHEVHTESTCNPRAIHAQLKPTSAVTRGRFEVPLSRKIQVNHAQREHCKETTVLGRRLSLGTIPDMGEAGIRGGRGRQPTLPPTGGHPGGGTLLKIGWRLALFAADLGVALSSVSRATPARHTSTQEE